LQIPIADRLQAEARRNLNDFPRKGKAVSSSKSWVKKKTKDEVMQVEDEEKMLAQDR